MRWGKGKEMSRGWRLGGEKYGNVEGWRCGGEKVRKCRVGGGGVGKE